MSRSVFAFTGTTFGDAESLPVRKQKSHDVARRWHFESPAFEQGDVLLESQKNCRGGFSIGGWERFTFLLPAPPEVDFEVTGRGVLFEPCHGRTPQERVMIRFWARARLAT
jgi:hypothetical protein